jgi:hypothetical protein
MRPVGFFGNKAERQAKAANAQAESERLVAMSANGLAAEVLPAFGPDGMKIKSGHRRGPLEVVAWLLPDAAMKYRQPVLGPVIEALGALEHADLLTRSSFGNRGQASTYRLTRLGETALAEGNVRNQLGTGMQA